VYLVSLDEPERNRAFAEALGAKHVVLSDPLKQAAEAYGVVALGGLIARRWTFYVDATGTLRRIDKEVDVASAGQDIARSLAELGFPRAR